MSKIGVAPARIRADINCMISMMSALIVISVLWAVASLVFCLALCRAAGRPVPRLEVFEDTGKVVQLPHPEPEAESNEETAL
ncbi:MAG: hypothetical protein DME19_09195 [Verrucomicrobia bacterium]|nr:MAG: hypothetical protein DME19_09195 [Verrucomicrobiota bacterium]